MENAAKPLQDECTCEIKDREICETIEDHMKEKDKTKLRDAEAEGSGE